MSYGKRMLSPKESAAFFCKGLFDQDGFEKKLINKDKGFGVFAEKNFNKRDFLLEYTGETLSWKEGEARLRRSPPNCFIFFIDCGKKKKCIDAINSTCQARFVNDSSKFSTACNSKMELLQVEGRTRLCLFASKDIQAGDEILYDYGDKNKNLWWRAKLHVGLSTSSLLGQKQNHLHLVLQMGRMQKMNTQGYSSGHGAVHHLTENQTNTAIMIQSSPKSIHPVLESNGPSLSSGLACPTCGKLFKKKGGLTMHQRTHLTKEPYKRPKRTCPYCEKGFDRLRRHIERMHQDQDAVQDMQDAPVREQREIASSLRKQGILCQNRKALGKEDHVLTGERKDVKDLVHCSMCKGFYSRLSFHKHRDRCMGDSAIVPKAIQVEEISESNDKFREVITGIQNDEIGQLAKRDQIIRVIGERLFKQTTRKVDKEMMSRHSVMGNMRLLARLLLTLRDQPEMSDDASAEQIFSRQTFSSLETAIIGLTSNPNSHDIKYGLNWWPAAIFKKTCRPPKVVGH
ncbi:hypothetical protein CAPTEDRAFT_195572 [Capitella teleta]|uniref:SET domain-containing protein n=1 Tax=Capitella teleta TaxID=283909 RepID=R7UU74_CAPTE|nr:hypothetical protein CAPTEDRAFT_195572 [Capitella teleta]|eukprot:ELU07472.1 hypothetical protein CAPTEDRAFT_195572 [Capitella teleta]